MMIEKKVSYQKELSNCTFVKTILMLIVVIYHCILYWSGSWFIGSPVYNAKPLTIIASWFNSFHIYGFTLVSGYLFYALKYEKGKYSEFIPFVTNKAKRLLLPYCFASLIWAIPFSAYYYKHDVVELVWNFAFGTAPAQLWFLLMLFFVFMIFYPLSSFFKNNQFYSALIALIIYGVGTLGAMVFPNVFQLFRAFTYIPFFLLGFKLRQYQNQKLRNIPSYLWILFDILLFVLTMFLSRYTGIFFSVLNVGLKFILNITGALMSFFVLQKIAGYIRPDENKVILFLSQHSMSVYLFHQQIVYVFISLLNGLINPYFHAGINFVVSMLISILLSMLFMKFKVTRMLIGHS